MIECPAGSGVLVVDRRRSHAEHLVEAAGGVHHTGIHHLVLGAREDVHPLAGQVLHRIDQALRGRFPRHLGELGRIGCSLGNERIHAHVEGVEGEGVLGDRRRRAVGLGTAEGAAGNDARPDEGGRMGQMQLNRHEGPGRQPGNGTLTEIGIEGAKWRCNRRFLVRHGNSRGLGDSTERYAECRWTAPEGGRTAY
jgi:hypothetical protein